MARDTYESAEERQSVHDYLRATGLDPRANGYAMHVAERLVDSARKNGSLSGDNDGYSTVVSLMNAIIYTVNDFTNPA